MSDYNGCYVKLTGDPTYWAVDGDLRHKVKSPAAMMAIGLRPVMTISQAELDAIPLVGQRKRSYRPDHSTAEEVVLDGKIDWQGIKDASIDATDTARELAAELGIPLVGIEGTGKDGRITVTDVRAKPVPKEKEEAPEEKGEDEE